MSHTITLTELFAHIEHYYPNVYNLYGEWFRQAITRDSVKESALSSQEARIKELEGALRECVYAVISGSSVVPPSAHQALSPEGERK